MKDELIRQAQKYLTVNDGLKTVKIVDIESLHLRHDTDLITMFLCDLYYEKHQQLTEILNRDDNSVLLDMTIGSMFRLSIAIRILKDIEQEENIDESEHRTAAGS